MESSAVRKASALALKLFGFVEDDPLGVGVGRVGHLAHDAADGAHGLGLRVEC